MTAPMCRLPRRRRLSRGPLWRLRPRDEAINLRWKRWKDRLRTESVIQRAAGGGVACRLVARRRQAFMATGTVAGSDFPAAEWVGDDSSVYRSFIGLKGFRVDAIELLGRELRGSLLFM